MSSRLNRNKNRQGNGTVYTRSGPDQTCNSCCVPKNVYGSGCGCTSCYSLNNCKFGCDYGYVYNYDDLFSTNLYGDYNNYRLNINRWFRPTEPCPYTNTRY